MLKSDSKFKKYWENRHDEPGFDWKTAYFDGWNHPHRLLILKALAKMRWSALFEVGCASGPNLFAVLKAFPRAIVGGVDVSEKAIEVARQMIPTARRLAVDSADDIFMPEATADVVLSDMTLIYLSKKKFRKALKEMYRITRKYAIFCEFHHKSLLKRLGLKLASGYNAYNYKKELERVGFRDIELHKLTEEEWPGGNPQRTYGYFITAKK